jgi:spore coat polysaccharide biosynthesis protein SpsF
MKGAIIQARMGSQRLPGKVLARVAGRPVLAWVIDRVTRARGLDTVIVATTLEAADDAVVDLCRKLGVACFRGSESDVLDRYCQTARAYDLDVIARITADCALIDPEVIDLIVREFETGKWDYTANTNPPSYPDGLDTEVFSRDSLERAWRDAELKSEREHVTLHIRNHPERYRIGNVTHAQDLSAMRWVVDEPSDLAFVRAIYDALGEKPFGMREVLQLLSQRPELEQINSGITRDEGLKKSLLNDGVYHG